MAVDWWPYMPPGMTAWARSRSALSRVLAIVMVGSTAWLGFDACLGFTDAHTPRYQQTRSCVPTLQPVRFGVNVSVSYSSQCYCNAGTSQLRRPVRASQRTELSLMRRP